MRDYSFKSKDSKKNYIKEHFEVRRALRVRDRNLYMKVESCCIKMRKIRRNLNE